MSPRPVTERSTGCDRARTPDRVGAGSRIHRGTAGDGDHRVYALIVSASSSSPPREVMELPRPRSANPRSAGSSSPLPSVPPRVTPDRRHATRARVICLIVAPDEGGSRPWTVRRARVATDPETPDDETSGSEPGRVERWSDGASAAGRPVSPDHGQPPAADQLEVLSSSALSLTSALVIVLFLIWAPVTIPATSAITGSVASRNPPIRQDGDLSGSGTTHGGALSSGPDRFRALERSSSPGPSPRHGPFGPGAGGVSLVAPTSCSRSPRRTGQPGRIPTSSRCCRRPSGC